MTRYSCCDSTRRERLKDHATLNGIDYVEVDDDASLTNVERLIRQRILLVYFVKPLGTATFTTDNFKVEGGERITGVQVESVVPHATEDDLVVVTVDRIGDFSTYQLKLVTSPDNPEPPSGFDPYSASVDFTFKIACPSDFDCADDKVCPPTERVEPAIDYLAKDYASFRRLMHERLGVLMPDWQAKTPADMGTAIVEALSFVGDHLSWRQDAIATEAYLETARLRTSVRRHARLVDYRMHDGRSARVWVHFSVSGDLTLPAHTQCMTRMPGMSTVIAPASPEYSQAADQHPLFFETLREARLFSEHNEMRLYAWGDTSCCLPAGSTSATLFGRLPELAAGDVLVFEEVLDPNTGRAEDANPEHRYAVRLTSVESRQDPLGGRFEDPPNDDPVDITTIRWQDSDALPAPVCISAETDDGYKSAVSVVRGNIVLADHGRRKSATLEPVPPATIAYPLGTDHDRCDPEEPEEILPRYRPTLPGNELTHAAPDYFPDSASAALTPPLESLKPAVMLADSDGFTWTPHVDLINSGPFSRHFVTEIEQDGSVALRFGDNHFGLFPRSGEAFTADYREGNGSGGNVGADAIRHVVSGGSGIDEVRNLLPGQGGLNRERINEALESAPYAFRVQERAVTAEDWSEVAKRHGDIQNAVATFRWTGSWYTVFLTVDRFGGRSVDAAFETELRTFLERYRLAGYDLEVDAPTFVSLQLKLHICVEPNFYRDALRQEVKAVLSNQLLPNSTLGVFHPDNFTFGQTVYLSPIVARIQAIQGVSAVDVRIFRRQGDRRHGGLYTGMLPMGRTEIARLDNNANFPEHGLLELELEGGV